MISRRRAASTTLVLVAVVATMVIMVGCGQADDDPAGPIVTDIPELVIAVPSEIQGTDPQQVTTTFAFVHDLINTPPISLGLGNDQIVPRGAKEVEVSEDGLEIRLTFDPNRTFHNGEPMSAEAFKRSVDRYLELSPYAFDFDPVEEIVIEGDTAILQLVEPGPGMFVVLGSSYAGSVEVGAAEEMGDDEFHRNTIGCGPYRVEEWVDGSHITLVRNDDYYDYLPFVENNEAFAFERITVRFIPEGFTRVSELRAGNIDLMSGVPSESLNMLREDPNIDIHEYMNSNVRYARLNTERFPLDDHSVRLAVALAMDRDEIMQGVDGVIQPTYSLVGPAMIRHHPGTEERMKQEFSHNLDRARQLLEDAGWEEGSDGFLHKDGEKLTFEFAFSGDNPIDTRAAPVIQSQMQRVGIDLQLREYEGRYLRELAEENNFDILLANWSWLDPGGVWPASLRTGGRLTTWSHPDVDAMLDEVVVEPDEDEGARMWGEITERVWEDVALFPLWSDRLFLASRDNVAGLHLSVSGATYLNDLTLLQD